MSWNRRVLIFFLAVITVSLTGCHLLNPPKPPEPIQCADDLIRVGDTLNIGLIVPNEGVGPDKAFLVGSDGTVNLNLLGPVKAVGMKFAEFEKEVQRLYIDKKLYRQITVTVRPGDRFYSVDGEVNGKGRQLYIGQTTVLRAIASCGGFTEFADRRGVQIIRANGKRETMDCKLAIKDSRFDLPLCPGDHVYVPRSL